MRGLILALVSLIFLSACSSGGSNTTSGSGITNFTSGTTGLRLSATLATESFSSDTVASDCSIPEDGTIDQRLSSDLGTITITVNDTSTVTTSNDKGIDFTSYTVSYRPVTAGAPALSSRSHGQSLPVFLGTAKTATASASVIVVELDTTKPEFAVKNTTGAIFTYNLTVTYSGRRTDTGEAVRVSATVPIELGDFCETTS